jgi:hypothetical protein
MKTIKEHYQTDVKNFGHQLSYAVQHCYDTSEKIQPVLSTVDGQIFSFLQIYFWNLKIFNIIAVKI